MREAQETHRTIRFGLRADSNDLDRVLHKGGGRREEGEVQEEGGEEIQRGRGEEVQEGGGEVQEEGVGRGQVQGGGEVQEEDEEEK